MLLQLAPAAVLSEGYNSMESNVVMGGTYATVTFSVQDDAGERNGGTGQRVTAALEGNAEQVIEVICSTDDICAACPNNAGGICTSEEKVARYDYEYAGKLIAERKFEQLEMYTMNLIMGLV